MRDATSSQTVQCGTFSCTLEGFDRPLAAIAALAAQFRRLAPKHRSFGAEPPLPDVGLLRRVAERTLKRPVAVTIRDRTVILRADPAVPSGAAAKAGAAAEPAPSASVPPARPPTEGMAEGAPPQGDAPETGLADEGTDRGPASTETGPDTDRKAEGRAILAGSATETKDLARLLRQANSEMDEPEKRRRQLALRHLKAAVAATVADSRAPDDSAKAEEAAQQDLYRADLARVIRPRRPGGARSPK